MTGKWKYLSAVPVLLCLAASFGFYRFAFYYPKKDREDPQRLDEKENYKAYADEMKKTIYEMDHLPYEEVTIKSRDGYPLYGRLYDNYPGRPLEIFFHGYHGTRYWDGYGCFRYCQEHRHNILMIDERAHGNSGSNTITFGIKERYDCLAWADYAAGRLGKDTKIVLSGVSMGAATVLMASELPLPSSVKAIIADCGYTSPEAIMKETARKEHIPVEAGFFFAKIGARLFGHFNVKESSAVKAVAKTQIPILFIQGTEDQVVPPTMCDELFEACGSVKKRITVKNSGHAVNAMTDPETYMREVELFLKECGIE